MSLLLWSTSNPIPHLVSVHVAAVGTSIAHGLPCHVYRAGIAAAAARRRPGAYPAARSSASYRTAWSWSSVVPDAADAHLKEVGKCAVEPVRGPACRARHRCLAVSGEGVVERVRLGAGRARGRYARAEAAQRRQNQQRTDCQRAGAVDDRFLDLAEVKYPQFARAVSAPASWSMMTRSP